MAGRGTSEVVELRGKLKVLESAVWALVERVTALEERAQAADRRRQARSTQLPTRHASG
jgi:hypothetical protein